MLKLNFAAMIKAAYILSIIFLGFLLCPTVVLIIDKNSDVSYIFSMTEEEQSKENKLPSEFVHFDDHFNQDEMEILAQKKYTCYRIKKDVNLLHLEVISPPPETA